MEIDSSFDPELISVFAYSIYCGSLVSILEGYHCT